MVTATTGDGDRAPYRGAAVHRNAVAVARALREAGAEGEVVELTASARTAAQAAQALGCPVGAIANSLVFLADGEPVLVLTSGGHRVDVDATAAALGASELIRPKAMIKYDFQSHDNFLNSGDRYYDIFSGHLTHQLSDRYPARFDSHHILNPRLFSIQHTAHVLKHSTTPLSLKITNSIQPHHVHTRVPRHASSLSSRPRNLNDVYTRSKRSYIRTLAESSRATHVSLTAIS